MIPTDGLSLNHGAYNANQDPSYRVTVCDIKPISVNRAFRGRRYPTKEYQDYKRFFGLSLPRGHVSGNVALALSFHLPAGTFAKSDVSNLIKATEDALVERGIIDDDRHVISVTATKICTGKDYRIGVTVTPWVELSTS